MWKYLWSKIFGQWTVKKMPDEKPTAKLSAAINAAIENKAWTSLPDGTTFCNDFCQEIAHAFGITELDGMLARAMGEHILSVIAAAGSQPCRWQEVTAAKAVEMAMQGSFILGWSSVEGEAHGHVVVVAPEVMEMSITFGGPVPMVASIAPNPFLNRIMKVSEAYRVANKPSFFAWLGS